MGEVRYHNGNRWRKARARVRARHDDCGICNKPIDYSLPASDQWGFVVDHIIPVKLGGALYDLDNLQAAHNRCNLIKSDKLDRAPTGPVPHSRDWGL